MTYKFCFLAQSGDVSTSLFDQLLMHVLYPLPHLVAPSTSPLLPQMDRLNFLSFFLCLTSVASGNKGQLLTLFPLLIVKCGDDGLNLPWECCSSTLIGVKVLMILSSSLHLSYGISFLIA